MRHLLSRLSPLALLLACGGPERARCPIEAGVPVTRAGLLGGRPLGALELGAPVTSRDGGWLAPEGTVEVKLGETWGAAPAEALIDCPVTGEDAWVVVPSAVRLDGPGGQGRQGLERLEMGARLVVARALPGVREDFAAVLKDGVPIGFVATSDIDVAPPSVERQLQAARQAVRDGDLLQAAPLVRHLAEERPDDAAILAFAAAIEAATSGRSLDLGPAAIPPARRVEAPGTAWIVAEGVGSPASPELQPWSLGAEVEVATIEGDEAVLLLQSAQGAAALEVGAIDGPADAIAAATARAREDQALRAEAAPEPGCAGACWGRVPLSALDAEAPTPAGLTARAAALPPGDPSATALARAAVRMGGLGEADRQILARVAAAAGDDVLAVALAAPSPDATGSVPDATGSALAPTWAVELRSVLGCALSGEPDPASPETALRLPAVADLLPQAPEWLGPDDEPEAAPDPAAALAAALPRLGPACLTDVPVWTPCDRPAPPSDLDLEAEEGEDEAEIARRRAEAEAEFLRADAAWESFAARRERWLGALLDAFPGSRVRVVVRNPGLSPTPAATLLLYRYAPRLGGYCGIVESAARTELQSRTLDLPPLAPGQSLVLWFDTPTYLLDYGAFVATSPDEIPRLLEALGQDWLNSPDNGALPFQLPAWARDRAAQDGPGPDACPTMACGC